MADSTTHLAQIEASQAQKEVTANGLFDAASTATAYGRRAEACAGLTWGYYGVRYGGSTVANGTNACDASDDTYMVIDRADGSVSFDTATTDWDDTTNYGRAYKITTNGSTVTSYEDHRFGPGGIAAAADPAPLVEGGRHAVPIMAGSMRPSFTGGCASLAGIASGSNQPDIVTLNFDASTQEYAQFAIPMPESWDEGTVSFVAHWSHPATTTNFGVVWNLQAVAVSDGDTIAASYGTAQTSTDTGGTTDDLYTSPESAAITVGGTPAAEDMVFFRVSRVTGDGGDTMAVDARLHGITLFIVTDADADS